MQRSATMAPGRRRSGFEDTRSSTAPAALLDQRPAAQAQRSLADAIHAGPRMTAQRQVLRMVSGGRANAVIQRTEGRYIGGRYVSGAEQDKDALTSSYYPTWAYVDYLKEGKYWGYRGQVPTVAWMNAWRPYEVAMEAAIDTWIQGGREDFAPFARGSALWTLYNTVLATGGVISHGQAFPGSIPMRDDPDEVVVDGAVNAAHLAYTAWDRTLANRGPFHAVAFTARQLKMFSKRPNGELGGHGWGVHPSLTTKWALHRPGPSNAEIDPLTEKPATFIFHVRSA